MARWSASITSSMWRSATREGREASQPDRRGDRQPKRQGGAKRGASIDDQGFDAGKKVTGRKRHIIVDTLGLILGIVVHPGDVQDRDGARELLGNTRRRFPFIEVIYADGGYQGPKMAATVAKTGVWRIEIVKRNEVPRFEVLPKRWIPDQVRDRANLRLDQPQQAPRPRLRASCPFGGRLHPPRHDPHHAA